MHQATILVWMKSLYAMEDKYTSYLSDELSDGAYAGIPWKRGWRQSSPALPLGEGYHPPTAANLREILQARYIFPSYITKDVRRSQRRAQTLNLMPGMESPSLTKAAVAAAYFASRVLLPIP